MENERTIFDKKIIIDENAYTARVGPTLETNFMFYNGYV